MVNLENLNIFINYRYGGKKMLWTEIRKSGMV